MTEINMLNKFCQKGWLKEQSYLFFTCLLFPDYYPKKNYVSLTWVVRPQPWLLPQGRCIPRLLRQPIPKRLYRR